MSSEVILSTAYAPPVPTAISKAAYATIVVWLGRRIGASRAKVYRSATTVTSRERERPGAL